ncbi:hypothetical protein [Paracoccus sp. N5]|uniref:hypothetical protein n=1 Tax=Paracoccus sp. N5 TaxID=1101189 RepID=UPI00055B8BA3|nr:hypothetical protein [Paracoccus sp. N5]
MNDTWTPSNKELELLSTSDEDIQKRHQTFCFHRADFTKRIGSGDRWQQLIQAHLYFEHVVAQILTEALAKPEAISLSRMGFSQRMDLVVAMALLPDELVTPIRKISGLRNKIAHDLTFEVGDSDVRDLENCTPVNLRDAVQAEAGRMAGPLELHELLTVILLRADIIRQDSAARREIGRKSELRLRTVLRKTPNVKYVR